MGRTQKDTKALCSVLGASDVWCLALLGNVKELEHFFSIFPGLAVVG